MNKILKTIAFSLAATFTLSAALFVGGCSPKGLEKTLTASFSEQTTAEKSFHSGTFKEYPATTSDTLKLEKDFGYTLTKRIETTSESNVKIKAEYVFGGKYSVADSVITLEKASTCTYSEDYGDLNGKGLLKNRSGTEKTDETALEHFNSAYLVRTGNADMKIKINDADATFSVETSYMSIDQYWGMTKGNYREMIVDSIRGKYEQRMSNEIVFYGASNFRLWDTMEEDMLPYKVQNHGIGGSTDAEQIEYADRLLYPFNPKIVFIQTGSNGMNQGASFETALALKQQMYETYREKLPNATLIVMAALPLPKRQDTWENSKKINEFSKKWCEEHENMYFIDATDKMLSDSGSDDMYAGDGKYFRPEYFIADGLHLNSVGRPIWTEMMKAKLAELGVQ